MDSNWLLYVLVVILVALSAFFSASETAFSTVNKIRLKNYADNGNRKAKIALFIAENYDRALSTILIGNNIVNIASSSIATVLAVALLGPSGAAVATVVMTIVVLTFGEVLPKSLAKENSERLSLAVAKVLRVLRTVTYPLVFLFIKLKELAVKISKSGESGPSVTEEELKYIIESSEEEGVLEKQESELVQSALEFDETTVQEVLTPRVDMVALDIEDDFEKNRSIILKERFSRIPVYQDSIDNIIGILHTRDYLEALVLGETPDIKKLIQPAFFVYKTKSISSLLADFKRTRVHVAIIADDYGGTVGMVTMEDLLEQLVGDIWDEDEEIQHKYETSSDGGFLVSGDLNIDDLFDLLHFDPKRFDSNYSSVSGWVLETFDHIPKIGESFTYRGIHVTVKEVDDQRIKQLHVIYFPHEDEALTDKQDD